MPIIRKEKMEKQSVKSQLLIGYLMPIIVFSVVFILTTFIILWNRTATNIYSSYNTNVTQINLGISDYITKLDNGLLNLYNDQNVFEYLRSVSREVLYGDNQEEYEYTANIQDRLNNLLNLNIEMYSVSLIDMRGRVQTVYKHGVLPYTIEFSDAEYDELRTSHGELIVLSGRSRKNIYNKDTRVISVGRKLIDSGNPNSLGTYIGYAIVEFEVDAIKELVDRHCLNDGFSVFIHDENNDFIYSASNKEWASDIDSNAESSGKVSFRKDGYVVQENEICSWKIVGVIGRQMIREQALSMGMPLFLLAFGCMIIIMMISLHMGGTISDMLTRINHQAHTLVEMEREQKDMQIKMLYSQIKPHFLYNTLESIRMMSLVAEKEQVSKAIKALADIFRYNTSKTAEYVTVQDEILHVQNYFLLQKLRLGDKVDFICEVDEHILKNKMMPFILQPLVENSIKHGLKKQKGKGVITVRINGIDDHLVFSVSDNGCGMNEEQILTVFKVADEGADGIGLNNINRRLEILCGEKLEIESEIGKGTTIRFRIPRAEGVQI